MTQARQDTQGAATEGRVRFSDAMAFFGGGFLLGILFNVGDILMAGLAGPSWPNLFFYGVPVVALLWVVLPFRTRPFPFSAALFLGLAFGFLGGTLILLNLYGH